MFFGEFDHSLDAKGRVILPAEFRDRLEEGGFITKVL
ncbi:MAG: cell division/cell wall cluster transcriptional repressor MraZ, partial [Actinobacteria bacterium]|nr:cell division/cell wall cluster transcriptional repressor MraZ [Actinomycetota bacterium]